MKLQRNLNNVKVTWQWVHHNLMGQYMQKPIPISLKQRWVLLYFFTKLQEAEEMASCSCQASKRWYFSGTKNTELWHSWIGIWNPIWIQQTAQLLSEAFRLSGFTLYLIRSAECILCFIKLQFQSFPAVHISNIPETSKAHKLSAAVVWYHCLDQLAINFHQLWRIWYTCPAYGNINILLYLQPKKQKNCKSIEIIILMVGIAILGLEPHWSICLP